MSTHQIEVVPVVLEKHPNAEKLSIVKVYGYTVCVQTEMWKDKTIGAYIPPDFIVPTDRPEFSFLGEHSRIKVKKLRGVISQGLLVPAPEGSKIGDDVMSQLGITRYVPPEPMSTGGETSSPPEGHHPNYDVEGFHRYLHLFTPGEKVWVTEKIHGTSARYTYQNGQLFCGSRTEWKKESDTSVWWKAIKKYPEVINFLKLNPEITIYGEVYGAVQDLKYGHQSGHVSLAVFDLMEKGQWLNPIDLDSDGKTRCVPDKLRWVTEKPCPPSLPWIPFLGVHDFDIEKLKALAEGESLIPGANHLREGIVIKPLAERTCPEIGRVQLKIVSNAYLER